MGLTRRALLTVPPAVLVAGCDSSSSSAGRLEIGVVPVIDVAPLFLGVKLGFFTDQRLEVTPKLLQSGATIVAAVIAGDQKIGFSNNTSLLIAASKKAPLRLVTAGNQAADGDYAVVFTAVGTGLKSPVDLAGRTIAVNSLNNVGSLSVNTALKAKGVDITGVKYVEIPFPQMAAALGQRRVDAVWAVEPFVSAIKAEGGADVVLRPYPVIAPHFPVASYFTSTAFLGRSEDIVSRFRTAMNQSLSYAQSHADEIRAVLPEYIDLSPEIAAGVTLPEWDPDLSVPLLERTADLALEYGYLTSKPDVAQLAGG